MNSKVWAFELQDDRTLKKQPVSLAFPRPRDANLYIITNKRSRCHFLQDSEEQQSFHKTPGVGKISEEKKLIQYGVSTKVFSVTDPNGAQWEVRLLLSPSEIARLSSTFNLIGYLSTHLVNRESLGAFEKLVHEKQSSSAAQKVFQDIAPFLCLSLESVKVEEFCTQLRKIVNEACKDLCGKEKLMVAGGMAALLVAEMAAYMVGSEIFDYTGEKTASQEDQNDQIAQMVAEFNIQADQLAVKHQEKSVRIIFRNPCPDNWASGGRLRTSAGMFEFGLCHKIFSIHDPQSEIQFLQSLQVSYDMVAVFNVAAFAERLLMTKKWRKTLDILLKEGQKKTINELSQLADQFICSDKCNAKIFQKSFGKDLPEKLSKVKTLQGSEEMTCVFGVLVAITAALRAKSIADNPNGDSDLSSDEEAKQPGAPIDKKSKEDPVCILPKPETSGYPKPEIIGPKFEKNYNVVNDEKANENIGGTPRGEADGGGDEEGPPFVEHPDIPEDVGDNQVIPSLEETSEALKPPEPAVEPQDFAEIPTNSNIRKDDRGDPDKIDATNLGSSSVLGQVIDTESGSKTTYDKDTTLGRPTTPDADTTLGRPTTHDEDTPLSRPITHDADTTLSRPTTHDADTTLGRPTNPDADTTLSRPTTPDADTTLSRPTSNLESSNTNLQKASNQDTPKIGGSGGKSLSFDSQNDPMDQVGDHPLDTDLWREDPSNTQGATPMFLILLAIMIVALATFMFPSRLMSVLFTGSAIIGGIYLFFNWRP